MKILRLFAPLFYAYSNIFHFIKKELSETEKKSGSISSFDEMKTKSHFISYSIKEDENTNIW